MKNKFLYEYVKEWYLLYKKDAIKEKSLLNYSNIEKFLKIEKNKLKIKDLNRRVYQEIINEYSKKHSRSSTKLFNRLFKRIILDLVEEGIIKNPIRNISIKGIDKIDNKKYLSKDELIRFIRKLELNNKRDLFIYIVIKTGLRYSEALALEYEDIDFRNKSINICKTLTYTDDGYIFEKVKTNSSNRKIYLDNKTLEILKGLKNKQGLIFDEKIHNSSINNRIKNICKKVGIEEISIHKLRHTHASLLLYEGVSILSISKRLGHKSVKITQETYLHIIKELEERDRKKLEFLEEF